MSLISLESQTVSGVSEQRKAHGGLSPLQPMTLLFRIARWMGFPVVFSDPSLTQFEAAQHSNLLTLLQIAILLLFFGIVQAMIYVSAGVNVPEFFKDNGMTITDIIAAYCGFVPNIFSVISFHYLFKTWAEPLTRFSSSFAAITQGRLEVSRGLWPT